MEQKNCIQRFAHKLNTIVENFFEKWGELAFKYSYIFFLASIALTIAFGTGFFFYEESDGDNLWVPEDSKGIDNRDQVNDTFETSQANTFFFVVSKSDDKLLTANAMREILQFDTGYKTQVSADNKRYSDLCYRLNDESDCSATNHPLEFWEVDSEVYDLSTVTTDSDVLQKINSGKGPLTAQNDYIDINNIFSELKPNPVTTNENGTNNAVSATAARWIVYFSAETDDRDRLEKYEEELEDYCESFNDDSRYIDVYVIGSTAYSRGLSNQIGDDLNLLQVGITLIVLWSIFSLSKLHPHYSRGVVALVGVISVGFAYLQAIGLGTWFGIEGSGVVQVLPFLMIGIGVDDMYVLIFTLDQAPKDAQPIDRIKYMMRHAGTSITITSFTNVFSFTMGSLTTLPAVRTFCQYAALGMFFDYLNQITFFLAFVVWDTMRSEKKCGDWCGLCMCKPDSKFFCKGKYSLDQDGYPRESRVRVFFREYYAKLFSFPLSRILICILFLGLTGLNIYGATQLELQFDIEWFLDPTQYVNDAIDVRDEYFESRGATVKVYTFDADFKTEKVQKALEELADNFDACTNCDKSWVIQGTTDSWYENYKSWIQDGKCTVNGQRVSLVNGYIAEQDFYPCLLIWKDSNEAGKFSSSLAWKSDNTLEAAYLSAELISIDDSDDAVQLMNDTRDICDDFGPGDTFPYNRDYLFYEQYAVFEEETSLSLGLSCAMVFTVVILLTADFVTGSLVLVMVGLVVLYLMGTYHLWGEHLNSITMTNAIVAIGISVDHSVHLAQAFKESIGSNAAERLKSAFDKVGLSVFNGGVSTFLAILSLVGAKSYIFQIFFKAWLIIILFGIGNALILLPTLLYFVNPCISNHRESKIEHNSSSGER